MIEFTGQAFEFLRRDPIGQVFAELDVHLGEGPTGGDLVDQPEVFFV